MTILTPEQIHAISAAARELDVVQASTFRDVCASHEALRQDRDALDQALRDCVGSSDDAPRGCLGVLLATAATIVGAAIALLGLAAWIALSGCWLPLEYERTHAADHVAPAEEVAP